MENNWIDLKRARKLDEETAENRKTKQKTCLIFLLAAAGGAGFQFLGMGVAAVVSFVAAGLLLVLMLIQNTGKPKNYLRMVYEDGVATPAIVTKTDPLTVYALGNLDYSGENRIYGLRWFELKELPGHQAAVGERIPCASMFEESKERPQFRRFRIHPYCWATDQNTVLEDKIREIDEKEWELLNFAYEKYGDLEHLEILELRPDGTPICRRYDNSEKYRLVATEEMKAAHPKKAYPAPPQLPEDMKENVLYQRLAELAARKKVYEYICQPDEKDELITIFSNPAEFAKRQQENRNALQDNEIPLIFCYCMVTSRGIWRKKAFIPWKQAVVTTGKAPLGEDMTIYINEKSIARPAYQRTYYQISPEAEVLYALEESYMREFFMELGNLADSQI